jgi:hypothetical protein
MRWTKAGLIFDADRPGLRFIRSHTQVPVAFLREDRMRIYFSTRPEPGFSLPAFIDVDIKDPQRILSIHDQPVIGAGPPGSFDEHGVMPAMVLDLGDAIGMYYAGWSRLAGSAPYNNLSGLAVSRDDGVSFVRAFQGPLLARNAHEPYSAIISWVMKASDGRWHAWYASTTGWVDVAGRLENVYVICHAESSDGVNWDRDGKPIIPAKLANEAQSRPTILYWRGRWHMWFSYRGSTDFRSGFDSYRIGYASSDDMLNWARNDEAAGIEPAGSGWDSTMIAYPFVVQTSSAIYMLYNGNGFGQSGIGLAYLEDR